MNDVAAAGDAPHQPGNVLIHLDNTKAGMGKVDKAHVEQIINEMSAGSPFYINEQRKADARKKKIDEILKSSSHFDKCCAKLPEWKAGIEQKVAKLEERIESGRNFDQWFVHLDMDMFFAAVEEKLNPQLKTVPMAVGGLSMLSTSNYIAREYGVRAGMPGFIAKRLCPELVLVHSSFDVYRAESEVVRGIAAKFDPNFHSGGLDELTLNVTRLVRPLNPHRDSDFIATGNDNVEKMPMVGSAAEVASELRQRVFDATGLTASAGIAPTSALAKIVGNFNKPNGQYVLEVRSRAEVMAFMATLQIRKVPGIGKAMEEILASLGIISCDQLYDQRHKLFYCIGGKTFEFLLEVGLGLMGTFFGFSSDSGDAAVAGDDGPGRRSIGHERTFRSLGSPQAMIELVEKCLHGAHETLVEEGLQCEQVVLKLKDKSFAVHQHSKKLKVPTDRLEDLDRAVRDVVNPHLANFASLRLLGVRLTDLTAKGRTDQQQQHSELSPCKQATLSQLFSRHEAIKSARQPHIFDVDSSSAEILEEVIVVDHPETSDRPVRKRLRAQSDADSVVILDDSDSDVN